MFTGLIEEQGRVAIMSASADGARLGVESSLTSRLERGDSVAVDGVCVTVVGRAGALFEADIVARTLAATTLGNLRRGDVVNLERALSLGDRLGGHFVTGHVDGVGEVVATEQHGAGREVLVRIPSSLRRFVAARGSVAIDGISLTVASIENDAIRIALIPETLSATKAGRYASGTAVNVEVDVLARYIDALARGSESEDENAGSGITLEKLKELGFLGR